MSNETFVYGATTEWLGILEKLVKHGQRVNVRGREIVEILSNQAVIDMQQPIVNVLKRKLGLGFLFAEAGWILGGKNDVQSIAPFSKQISNFSDDGLFFKGAYGPQVVQQLPYILETLTKDLYSRQAVTSIWKPSPGPSKDIPCTLTYQIMVRGNLVHMFLNMRSSDVWLGVPYDWFNFTMIAHYVLKYLRTVYPKNDLQIGYLYFNAASQHYYVDDEPKILDILADSREGVFKLDPRIHMYFPGQSFNNFNDLLPERMSAWLMDQAYYQIGVTE